MAIGGMIEVRPRNAKLNNHITLHHITLRYLTPPAMKASMLFEGDTFCTTSPRVFMMSSLMKALLSPHFCRSVFTVVSKSCKGVSE